MSNDYFQFKEFLVRQSNTAMKVTTDSCLFGAWCANEILNERKTKTGISSEKALDIGAGTGLLSLMVAQKNEIHITAIEIEKNAAAQSRENILRSAYSDKITVLETDIVEFPEAGYDFIVCNPPFYENELRSPKDSRNIAHHSDLLKWDQLFPVIQKKLRSGGSAFLLLPASRVQLANELMRSAGLFINKEIQVLQTDGRSPFRRMLKISDREATPVVEEMVIREEDGEYSDLFKSYLKDYYLNL